MLSTATMHRGDDAYAVDASECGLAPGVFPSQLSIDDRPFLRGHVLRDGGGDIVSVRYTSGSVVVIIYND